MYVVDARERWLRKRVKTLTSRGLSANFAHFYGKPQERNTKTAHIRHYLSP